MPRRRLGNSAIDQNLTVRITKEMRADIDRIARQRDWTVGLVVREALRAGLAVVEQMRNGHAGNQDHD